MFYHNIKEKCSKHSAFAEPKVNSGMNFVIKHFTKDVCYSAVSRNIKAFNSMQKFEYFISNLPEKFCREKYGKGVMYADH